MTIAPTCRTLHPDIEDVIKKKFGYEKGRVSARRDRLKNGSYSEWKVVICWREGGSIKCRTLGKLTRVLEDIGFRTNSL